jgi:hypothetical protein
MDPRRKSNGYTSEGKKKYIRSFVIKKIKTDESNKKEIKEINEKVNSDVDVLQIK